MSFCKNLKVQSNLFTIFLFENNFLGENLTITKKDARKLYSLFVETYPVCKTIKFQDLFRFLVKNCLPPSSSLETLYFRPNRLQSLLNQKSTLFDIIKVYADSNIKKKTLISQRFSFKNETEREPVLTDKKCTLCNAIFQSKQNYDSHTNSRKHLLKYNFYKSTQQTKSKGNAFEATIKDFPLNNVIVRKNVQQNLTLHLKSLLDEVVEVHSIDTKSEQNGISLKDNCPLILNPKATLNFPLIVNISNDGLVDFPVVFNIKNGNIPDVYAVLLTFSVHDEFLDFLHPTEPYKRPSKAVITEFEEDIDRGPRPVNVSIKPKKPLLPYKLSATLSVLLNSGLKEFAGITEMQLAKLQEVQKLLNVEDKLNCLTPKNYTDLFDLLLYIEEHQMKKDIRDYDKHDQILTKNAHNTFYLDVPDLAEHRPSVLMGDEIKVKQDKNSTKAYAGYVKRVEEARVLLEFSNNFGNIYQKGMKFTVIFDFNRYPIQTEHQAVQITKIDNISGIFFPNKIIEKPLPPVIRINWVNKLIADNKRQQEAVYCILNKTSFPHPYLIFGPPGTGKTLTLVESIKQIYAKGKTNILVCTPSNNAANLIASKLSALPRTDLLRYVAKSYSVKELGIELQKFSNFDKAKQSFYVMTGDEVAKYRIVVTTLVQAARLINYACPKNHFEYVFIDECGQATETEALIPIAGIISERNGLTGQVVLAGDPEQLGPIIHSSLAGKYGYDRSMLERLMKTIDAYKIDEQKKYNTSALTKLLKNYRSHPAIFKVSNERFYAGELIPSGELDVINMGVNHHFLPNKKLPVLFYNVVGTDVREKNSPSFFNIEEIGVVLAHLESLLGDKLSGRKITEKDIGIITPYRKQVEKIRNACAKKKYNLNDLFIGSVEKIQGQERLIIIISTVRSKTEFLEFDYKFNLGFLKNSKRFNVAMTRAKALLIVIGNANVLQYDANWRSFLEFCYNNNAVSGTKFEFIDELCNAMQQLGLGNDEDNDNVSGREAPDFGRGHK